MDYQTLFLSLQGRINRREFWLGFVLLVVTGLVLNLLFLLVPPLGQTVSLLLLWPQVCLQFKRLHDMGRSAWLLLIPAGILLVCGTVALLCLMLFLSHSNPAPGEENIGAVVGLLVSGGLALLCGLIFLLWVGLSRGEPGPNRFGPPPGPRPLAG